MINININIESFVEILIKLINEQKWELWQKSRKRSKAWNGCIVCLHI
jgi:hypothetical protein